MVVKEDCIKKQVTKKGGEQMEKLYNVKIRIDNVDSNVNKDIYTLSYPEYLDLTCEEEKIKFFVNMFILEMAEVDTPDYFDLEIYDVDYTIMKKEEALLNQYVKSYIQRNLITITEFANRLQTSRTVAYKVLNGKRISLAVKRRVADLLGIKYNELPKEKWYEKYYCGK